MRLLSDLRQDLRYSLRNFRRAPLFTAVAVLTLTLGIGATTAIFSTVNGVLLQSLPYPEPDRIVQLWEIEPRDPDNEGVLSPMNLRDISTRASSFDAVAGYSYEAPALTGMGNPERVRASGVSADFFKVFGVSPILGRDFLREEDAPGNNQVVILSHGAWERRFASSPEVIGRVLRLNGEPHTVIGVAPKHMTFPNSPELYLPLATDFKGLQRGSHFLFAVGRVKPDVPLATVQAELQTIAKAVMQVEGEDGDGDHTFVIVPLHEELVGDLRLRLMVLMGAVIAVLLIACVNVANLLLARAAARQKEIAIRLSIGASRGRIIRQLLHESLVLSLLSGGLGVVVASWGVDLLVAASPVRLPNQAAIGMDAPVLFFALGVAVLTGILFGLAPALQASSPSLTDWMKEAAWSTAAAHSQRLRSSLVVAQMALSLVLLIGAGLLVNSFLRLQSVSPGFDPENVLTLKIPLPPARAEDGDKVRIFAEQVLERMQALPGVRVAAIVDDLPFSGSRSVSTFDVEGRENRPEDRQAADARRISPQYFEAMRIELRRGRAFHAADSPHAEPVAIVNEAFVRRFFPAADPLGKRIRSGPNQPWRAIVGVVSDIHHDDLRTSPLPEMYFPLAQRPADRISLVLRASGEPAALAASARAAVAEVDADQPVFSVATMASRVRDSVAGMRFNAQLLGGFAIVALLMAALGIYGVISYAVTQRTREFGVRVALGATHGHILGQVLGHGLRLAALGVLLGLMAAVPLTRALGSLLFEVNARDPLTYLLVAGGLIGVALLATYLPARRATRVDPMVALRYE